MKRSSGRGRWRLLIGTIATLWFPAALFGDVVVDSGSVVQNEVSLTLVPGASPGVPSVLLAGYNDNPYAGTAGLGVSRSTDGGATWTSAQLSQPVSGISGLTLGDAFDPSVTADHLGNLYAAQISTDSTSGGVSGLYVRASTDGGASWLSPYEVSADPASSFGPAYPTGGDPAYRFNDRDQITADTYGGSPYQGRVYVTWIRDRGWYEKTDNTLPPGFKPPSDIYVARSNAQGASLAFNSRIQINDAGPVGSNLANSPVPAVAPNGTVYVSWLDYDVWNGGTGTIYLDKSTDGGDTWGIDKAVTTINLPPLSVTAGAGAPTLAKGAPVLAVSPNNSNELYLAYAADPLGADESDIFLIKSSDGGVSWPSPPVRINDDFTSNDQILPWIDIKPDGTIDVAWYDRRLDSTDTQWDVFMARSTDGGTTFLPNVRLSDSSFTSTWLGEYLGLAVDSSYAYTAFTSTVNDSNGDIYFDSLPNSQIPEPSGPALLLSAAGAGLRRRR